MRQVLLTAQPDPVLLWMGHDADYPAKSRGGISRASPRCARSFESARGWKSGRFGFRSPPVPFNNHPRFFAIAYELASDFLARNAASHTRSFRQSDREGS